MAQKRIQYVKTSTGLEKQLIASSADIVEIEAINGIEATNVQGALEELKNLADTGGVTSVAGVKGDVLIANSTVSGKTITVTSVASATSATKATQDGSGNVITSTYAKQADLTTHTGSKANPHGVTKAQVGLGNVTNDAQVKASEKGVAGGVATLGTDGKVPTSQLPAYVDDVLEYEAQSKFPTTGETGKIYVDTTTNKTYRWGGSAYVEISASLALGETSSTAYAGDKGKTNATNIATLQGQMSTANSNISTLQTADGQNVKLTGDQTIAGAKTFSGTVNVKGGLYINANDTATQLKSTHSGSSPITVSLPNKAGTLALDTVATTSANGLMSSTDKSKLDGIATGATANKGTVTSVGITAGTGISVSGSPVTSSGSITVSLKNSGVSAGTYSALTVDATGRATAGAQIMEWGTSGQTTPSASLAVGGLFFELVE